MGPSRVSGGKASLSVLVFLHSAALVSCWQSVLTGLTIGFAASVPWKRDTKAKKRLFLNCPAVME